MYNLSSLLHHKINIKITFNCPILILSHGNKVIMLVGIPEILTIGPIAILCIITLSS